MPISPYFNSVFSKEWEINFTQCAPNGFLKYTELCNLIQLTAAAHSELGGISFTDMQTFNQAWVLSRMRVEIIRLPRWKDVVRVKTWINTLENSRSIRALELYINDEKVVGCETFWAVFNTKSRRPEALALPIDHFNLYPELKATQKSNSRINLNFDIESSTNRTIMLSDLDIVNHVNNIKYLDWCLDLIKTEYVLDNLIESFEMNFIKELSLNEEIMIQNSSISNQLYFSISKNQNTCFGLELNFK